jgi:hypothetical protein
MKLSEVKVKPEFINLSVSLVLARKDIITLSSMTSSVVVLWSQGKPN